MSQFVSRRMLSFFAALLLLSSGHDVFAQDVESLATPQAEEVKSSTGAASDLNTGIASTLKRSQEEQAAEDAAKEEAKKKKDMEIDLQAKIDAWFGENVVLPIYKVLFFDISFGGLDKETNPYDKGMHLIVIILLLGAIFFTFRYGFVQFRLFGHALKVIRGKYDDPNDHGEITHFQALTSALSATVGLGNIAGVALAIHLGGPGAIFWMWVMAIFGMASKFSSCTLGQLYRRITPDKRGGEHVEGGPMVYLDDGMRDMFGDKMLVRVIAKIFAISFAIFTILGALGGGNMFQANQTFEIVSHVTKIDDSWGWGVGIVMAILVAMVIWGGIRRVGDVTSKLVPSMCGFYVIVCLIILGANFTKLPGLFGEIFAGAFNVGSMGWGAFFGLLVTGIKRGAFSNEAGLGSAAIVHSAAKTDEPVREGLVGMVGPFIDTIVVCSMTALAILATGANKFELLDTKSSDLKGAALTAEAFATLHAAMPFFLCIAVFVFAYSTMIAWYYYGERAVEYLFGKWGILPFRVVYLAAIVVAPMLSLLNVKDFTDLLILSMAYPNVIGMVILSPIVVMHLKKYMERLENGDIKTFAEKQAEETGPISKVSAAEAEA